MDMTQDQQEADLDEARRLLHPTQYSADRCRHESITATSLWIFNGRRQIGSITREPGGWRASRMAGGSPSSLRQFQSLERAITHVTDGRNQ